MNENTILALCSPIVCAVLFIVYDVRARRRAARAKEADREAASRRERLALDLLTEAVAARAAIALTALRAHLEDVAAAYRAQVAEAETRARVAERRAAEATQVLQSATGLVRSLRDLVDETTDARGARTALLPPPSLRGGGFDDADEATVAGPGVSSIRPTQLGLQEGGAQRVGHQ